MAMFRYKTPKDPFYIELGWNGMSYLKNPIIVNLVEKNSDGKFSSKKAIGKIKYEKAKAKQGYVFKVNNLGEVTIKWQKKFIIINEMQVLVNGKKLKGNEVINYK